MNPDRTRILKLLENPGVIAVVRAPGPESIPHLMDALLAGGVHAIEITLTTPNAVEAIRQARESHGTTVLLGVGTVLKPEDAQTAIQAGAQFVVTPICRTDLVPLCHEHGCPILLGAYTPTETQLAHEAGADYIKLFPADALGPSFVKALRAPLPHLRIVPTGGVTPDNAAEFIRAGCAALGVGSSLIPAAALREKRWENITSLARAFVQGVNQGRHRS